MDNLRQYVMTIVAAAIAIAMIDKLSVNPHSKKLIRMVSGLLISVVLLSPLGDVRLSSYTSYFDAVDLEAREAVANGEDIYRDNLTEIIKERCETYILDKAKQLGAQINVSIQCDTSDIPIPVFAEITGNVSPYIRNVLQNMIAEDMGIPEEKQLWA